MANYSATKSKTAALVAATEDRVTITGPIRLLQVINHHSSARISVTLNGATATVDGDNTVPVMPSGVTTLYDADAEHTVTALDDQDWVVSLISSGTPTYTVVAL